MGGVSISHMSERKWEEIKEYHRRRDTPAAITDCGISTADWTDEQRRAATRGGVTATRKQVRDAADRLGAQFVADREDVEVTAPDGYLWAFNGEDILYEVFDGDAPSVWADMMVRVTMGFIRADG